MKEDVLVIVNPQQDFIYGSMKLPDAEIKIHSLIGYISSAYDNYSKIILIHDSHPIDYIGFYRHGGSRPEHCVRNTNGECIFDPLMWKIYELFENKDIVDIRIGIESDIEESSIINNPNNLIQVLETFEYVGEKGRIDIVGFSEKDFIKLTIRDLLRYDDNLRNRFVVLGSYISAEEEYNKDLVEYCILEEIQYL